MDPSDLGVGVEYAKAGFAAFLPTWRGENGNTGEFEFCYGEVDDLISAMEFASALPPISDKEVFFAGHSAGGTLTLLAAEMSDVPRGVLACGATPSIYALAQTMPPMQEAPFDFADETELRVRSPAHFADELTCPGLLYYAENEGTLIRQAEQMKTLAHPRQVDVVSFANLDHFTAITPAVKRSISFFEQQLARTNDVSREIDPLSAPSLLARGLRITKAWRGPNDIQHSCEKAYQRASWTQVRKKLESEIQALKVKIGFSGVKPYELPGEIEKRRADFAKGLVKAHQMQHVDTLEKLVMSLTLGDENINAAESTSADFGGSIRIFLTTQKPISIKLQLTALDVDGKELGVSEPFVASLGGFPGYTAGVGGAKNVFTAQFSSSVDLSKTVKCELNRSR